MNSSTPSRDTIPEIIFGAGEMADHVIRLLEWNELPTGHIQFYDDGYPAKTIGPGGLPVVGKVADGLIRCASQKSRAIIAVGTKASGFRYQLYRRLSAVGARLLSVAHGDLVTAPGSSYGDNCIFMSGCTLCKDSRIGALCFLSTNVVVEHDASIGSNVFFGPGATLGGHVKIREHAFIGVGVVIAPGVTIGARTLVGAGAVVVRDLPEGVVACGVPARIHRAVVKGGDVPTLEELA